MTWAAVPSTNLITGGAVAVALGVWLVALDRLDVGRFARRRLERFHARRIGTVDARKVLDRSRRMNHAFATVFGGLCIVIGAVLLVAGVAVALG